ncbi:MAG: FtsW/RodA/SpoVE family cell cycle protein [Armatimonadetes bacterium]|nr:FtsW/RodA/SpoVE family cell cycle protein [Armatimonadota bacterium]
MAEQAVTRQWSPARVAQGLLLLTVVGVVGGLLMVYSASYPLALARTGNAFSITSRQALYALLGFAFFVIAWKVPLQPLKRLGWMNLFFALRWSGLVLHSFVVLLLLLTLLFGKKVGEAQRWLPLGPFQIQPSEFAKITLVVCLASLASFWRDAKSARQKLWLWFALFAVWSLTVALVLMQPHLSGGLLLALIGIATMFFARLPLPALLAMLLLCGGLGYVGQKYFLHPYQRERWQIGSWWMRPEEKTDEQKSYQVRQALLGLQVGGWFGQGLFHSRQKHLFLPSAHNDFIFSVIGEEFGFVGSLFVLVFFGILAYWGLWVTSQSTGDSFASGIAGGVTIGIWLQAIMHIAVNAHLLPPTGIPLPFVSAGGSSLCATLIGMGLLLNVATNLQVKSKRRGGAKDAVGDGRWRDGGTYLSSPRPRRRRQNYPA